MYQLLGKCHSVWYAYVCVCMCLCVSVCVFAMTVFIPILLSPHPHSVPIAASLRAIIQAGHHFSSDLFPILFVFVLCGVAGGYGLGLDVQTSTYHKQGFCSG